MTKFLERFVICLAILTPFAAFFIVKHLDWYPYENQRVMFDGFPEGTLFLAAISIMGVISVLYQRLWQSLHNATIDDWALVLLTYLAIYFLSFSFVGLGVSAGWIQG